MRYSAAGKLMVAGEYAVAWCGTPALALSTRPIVDLRWSPVTADDAGLAVSLDAFGEEWRWTRQTAPVDGLGSFVFSALNEVTRQTSQPLSGELSVCVRADLNGRKLGLGSSAATTVATIRAAMDQLKLELDANTLGTWADRAHRAVQDGQGSGYDVHAIATGGCSRYDPTARRATPMGWPEGLHAVALYSGRPASTTAALKGGIDRQGEGVANIGAAALALIERWETGSVPAVLEALAQCERRFEALATLHPWLLPAEVRELKERITRAGATPRVSGAGGGDCVLAWSEDPEVLATLANENANVVVAQLPRELAKQEAS